MSDQVTPVHEHKVHTDRLHESARIVYWSLVTGESSLTGKMFSSGLLSLGRANINEEMLSLGRESDYRI